MVIQCFLRNCSGRIRPGGQGKRREVSIKMEKGPEWPEKRYAGVEK